MDILIQVVLTLLAVGLPLALLIRCLFRILLSPSPEADLFKRVRADLEAIRESARGGAVRSELARAKSREKERKRALTRSRTEVTADVAWTALHPAKTFDDPFMDLGTNMLDTTHHTMPMSGDDGY